LLAKYQDATHFLDDDTPLKEYDNMVVQTEQAARQMAADAFVAGVLYEKSNKFPDLKEYLTEIFGEGIETAQK
jgi:hypothetical protein